MQSQRRLQVAQIRDDPQMICLQNSMDFSIISGRRVAQLPRSKVIFQAPEGDSISAAPSGSQLGPGGCYLLQGISISSSCKLLLTQAGHPLNPSPSATVNQIWRIGPCRSPSFIVVSQGDVLVLISTICIG